MRLEIELLEHTHLVEISKNPHYSGNRFDQDFNPYDEPFDFEIIEENQELTSIERDELFEQAITIYNEETQY